ncbi:hypothetical protein LIER_36787 [Lithospermum erythrorhizon]|uniref:Reverse transcriptase domain-containing protein n=1 Tax=Lithospermum erythrorhizon TaxID=34254 RepID=A0AAV3PBB2_LITER
MISGGLVGGGDTLNSRKQYARRVVYRLASMATINREVISFSEEEFEGIEVPHDDPLIISPVIANFLVARMLVETGSSPDILYLATYDRLGLPRNLLKPACTHLTGFTGHSIYPVGIAELDFTVGEAPRTSTIRASFTVVDISDPSYNGFIDYPILTTIRAIVSPLHINEVPHNERSGRGLGGSEEGKGLLPVINSRGTSLKDPPRQKRHREGLPEQKKRNFSEEKNLAIQEEVEELIKAGAIRELQFPEWIANVVMVKKSNGKWRMCTDFTNLNKTCPKDYYPLPCLGRLVDASASHEVVDLLAASRGYHQILLEKADQEKTTFIMEYGLYCWKVLPFGLRKAGATYQRMVNAIFSVISARNLKAYFEAHPIVVVTEQPMKRILSNPAQTGRLTKWAIELSEFEITFAPKTGVKAQALVDFIIECTARDPQGNQEYVPELPERPRWILYINGAKLPEY